MLQLQVIGNLTKDAEVVTITSFQYIAATIAVNISKEKTEYINIRKRIYEIDTLSQYLTKGTKVYVQGNVTQSAYISKTTNEPKAEMTCWVSNLELLSSKQND